MRNLMRDEAVNPISECSELGPLRGEANPLGIVQGSDVWLYEHSVCACVWVTISLSIYIYIYINIYI